VRRRSVVRGVLCPLEMVRVVVIEIKRNGWWLLAAIDARGMRVSFKCAGLCPMILDGSLRMIVSDVVFRLVGGIPGATLAFRAEVPCFVVVFTSFCRVFRWIANPMR